MSKSYEERMEEKYNFLKKDRDSTSEISSKSIQNDSDSSEDSLLDEDIQEVISKVPVLGSIPILGRLFQSSSSTSNKKNLMVFLKPTILTDSDSSQEVSLEKYNYLKAQKELNGKLDIIDLTESKD